MKSQGRIRRQIASTFGANIGLQSLGVITGILAARLLGPPGNGELATIRSWSGAIAMISAFGAAEALVYYSAREPGRAGSWVATAQITASATTSIGVLVGLVALPHILGDQPPQVVKATLAFLLLAPLEALFTSWLAALRGLGRFTLWNALRFVPGLQWLAALVVGLSVGSSTGAAFALFYLAVAALVAPMLYLASFRWIPRPRRFRLELVRPLYRFGLPALGVALPQMLNSRVDLLALTALAPAFDSGLYAVGVSAAAIVGTAGAAVAAVVFPRVAQLRSQPEQRQLVVMTTRMSILPIVLASCMGALAVGLLIPVVYGEAYRPAVVTGLVLCVSAGVSTVTLILGEGLRGLGRQAGVMAAYAVGAFLTAAGIWLLDLIHSLSIVGAAVITCSANLAAYGYVVLVASRALSTNWTQLVTPHIPVRLRG